MSKRKFGRPKSVPEPDGLGRSALARHFNVALKVVDRWLREGCPCIRHNGRVYFDVATVNAWKNDFEQRPKPVAQAAVLHPDDPRYRERCIVARVKAYRLALDCNQMVPIDIVAHRWEDSLIRLNGALNSIPSAVDDPSAMTPFNACTTLAPLIDDALRDFRLDDPDEWPKPLPFIQPLEDCNDANEFDEKTYLPLLDESDPRAQIALIQAAKHETELANLESSLIAHKELFEALSRNCDAIRNRLRRIPRRFAKRAANFNGPARHVICALRDEIDAAKIALQR